MNQRGEYQTLNKRGDPVVYEETDAVIYNGSTYISQRRNTYLDGLPDATDGPWDLLSSRINHVSGKMCRPILVLEMSGTTQRMLYYSNILMMEIPHNGLKLVEILL